MATLLGVNAEAPAESATAKRNIVRDIIMLCGFGGSLTRYDGSLMGGRLCSHALVVGCSVVRFSF